MAMFGRIASENVAGIAVAMRFAQQRNSNPNERSFSQNKS
jgi:hypothetical protein